MRKLICLHDENSRIDAERLATASNTRGLSTVTGKYSHLDWFSGTFATNCHAALLAVLQKYFPEPDRKTDAKPTMSYHMAERWNYGVLISTTADYARSHISLSGEALEWLSHEGFLSLIRELSELGIKPTRIDVALDDYDRELSLDWHREQISLSKTLCYFRKANCISDLINDRLETIYLGRRGGSGSGVFYRIYDKFIQSEGKINAIRYEAEFTGDKVKTVFGMLLECSVTDIGTYEDTVAGLVLGCLDYRHKEGGKQLSRVPRVSEWESFLGSTITLRVSVPKAAPKGEFNTTHFVKQYARSLVVLELQQADNLPNLLFQCREHAATHGIRKVLGKIVGAVPEWAVSGKSSG